MLRSDGDIGFFFWLFFTVFVLRILIGRFLFYRNFAVRKANAYLAPVGKAHVLICSIVLESAGGKTRAFLGEDLIGVEKFFSRVRRIKGKDLALVRRVLRESTVALPASHPMLDRGIPVGDTADTATGNAPTVRGRPRRKCADGDWYTVTFKALAAQLLAKNQMMLSFLLVLTVPRV